MGLVVTMSVIAKCCLTRYKICILTLTKQYLLQTTVCLLSVASISIEVATKLRYIIVSDLHTNEK